MHWFDLKSNRFCYSRESEDTSGKVRPVLNIFDQKTQNFGIFSHFLSQNRYFDLQNKHQVCQIIWRQGLFCKKHLLKLQKKNFTWNCDKMASPKTRRVLAELRPRDENDVSLFDFTKFLFEFHKKWNFGLLPIFLGNSKELWFDVIFWKSKIFYVKV